MTRLRVASVIWGYTHIVQVNVDAAVLQNRKVADHVDALDIELVAVVRG
jgi:hypothetical protein